MQIRTKNLAWMKTASALVFVASAPVWADDTELLLLNPSSIVQAKPNVIFILDTSGSMRTEEETAAPYDSTQVYTAGTCEPDRLYWTDLDGIPVCAGVGLDTQVLEKSSFQCNSATRRMDAIGNYANTMAQWRSSSFGATTVTRWQALQAGNATAWVECQADRGTHGDGTAGDVYATAYGEFSGSGFIVTPWTSSASEALSWGSAPRNVEYTVFDGNWLNWNSNPVLVDLARMEIAREVTKTVLDALENINVGIMRFNNNEGGSVIQAIVDLDTNRAGIETKLNALVPGGGTPVSEVLYESALYWNGLPAEYGERINEHVTDPAALVATTGPKIYRSPSVDSCAKNYNILLSGGQANNNEDAHALVPSLPQFAALTGNAACTGANDGDCLDDIGEWLKLYDSDSIQPGVQNVTTHTIGFTNNIAILEDTAQLSGGKYFLADDVQSLTVALLKILNEISDKSRAFSAPAVSVNTFNRTQNLNDIYITMFAVKNKVHWPGNLKKYRISNRIVLDAMGSPVQDVDGNVVIDPSITDANGSDAVNVATGFFSSNARSFWSHGRDGNDVLLGGAASQLPAPGVRKLLTNYTSDPNLLATANALDTGNLALSAADFGLTGASGEPTLSELVNWMRGQDVKDANNDGSTTDARNAMGDPLHSQPASIVYGGTPDNLDVVVYTATNDGYLHAINGATGTELWSFVPQELLPRMARLYIDPDTKYKNYGLDGNIVPVVFDENRNGIIDAENDFVYILFGMRRGGNTYYALNVTNKNEPKVKWISSPPGIGQTWSPPVVARVTAPGVNSNAAVVIIGGGYDPVHDSVAHPGVDDAVGANILMLDLETGTELWRAAKMTGPSPNNLVLSAMTRAIPGEIRVIDLSGDGYADRMYAADLGGQILRFDIFNGQSGSNFVTGGVIAQLGAEGLSGTAPLQDTRRFYTSPDVSLLNSNLLHKRFLAISLGSGYRAHPLDNINSDRFYSLRDEKAFTQMNQFEYNGVTPVTESDLVEVSGSVRTQLTAGDKGWMFTLPFNQKVLSDSITVNNSIFFVAFSPDINLANACAAGAGTNFLYEVNVLNGDPVVNNLDALAAADADAARQSSLRQGGIAPSPAILFPSADPLTCSGAACRPPPIGCVGLECFDPGFRNNPVRTLWTQDGIQ